MSMFSHMLAGAVGGYADEQIKANDAQAEAVRKAYEAKLQQEADATKAKLKAQSDRELSDHKHQQALERDAANNSFKAGEKEKDRATSIANSIRTHSGKGGDSDGVDNRTGKKLRGQPRYDKDSGQFLVTFADGSMEWRQPEDIPGFKKPETAEEKTLRETNEQARVDAAATAAENAVSKRKSFMMSDEEYTSKYGMSPAEDAERLKQHQLRGGKLTDQKSPAAKADGGISKQQAAHESSPKIQGGADLATAEADYVGALNPGQQEVYRKIKERYPDASLSQMKSAVERATGGK